jgi:hypothetical protein
MVKRFFVLSVGAALVATAALVTDGMGARAQVPTPTITPVPNCTAPLGGESGGCLSDALVLSLQATITADSDGCGGGGDPVCAIDLIGGSGSFSAASLFCAGFSDGEVLGAPVPEPGLCSMSAPANFMHLVCATGVVTGGVANLGGVEPVTLMFNIWVYSGIGIFVGQYTDPAGDPGRDLVIGVMQLVPTGPGGDGVDDCATGFIATGALVGVEA